mmetsp:Transcript_63223/g.193396  ORF Transcript_63223/g.193396 Transcript_63223/m.193396 type:complete len:80 (+) Transcript_63223:215-454(+)
MNVPLDRPALLKITLSGMTMVLVSALYGADCIMLVLQRRADAIVNAPIHTLFAPGPAATIHFGQGNINTADASNTNEHQ